METGSDAGLFTFYFMWFRAFEDNIIIFRYEINTKYE